MAHCADDNGLLETHISPRQGYTLTLFADGVSLTRGGYTQNGGGTRGAINGFSKQSRKRLMQTLARVRDAGDVLFVTLTYPSVFPTEYTVYKRHLDTFCKALSRKSPGCGWVWRLEYQKRGAPHYHLLLFRFSPQIPISLLRRWIAATWYRIVASGDERHLRAGTQAKKCDNRRKLYGYVSKYVAKPSENCDAPGRHTGRFWGIGGEINLDEYLTVIITGEQVVELKRYFRKWLVANRGESGKRYARWIARNGDGTFVLGLGMESQNLPHGQTILRMLTAIEAFE
jgi:hypothetical protein